MLKCNLFLVLKKYVPGITHQLCTVANWNPPQLSKDLLLRVGVGGGSHKSNQIQ